MKFFIRLVLLSFLAGCQSSRLPSERYSQYDYRHSYSVENNELKVELGNPLHCPLRVWILTPNEDLQSRFNEVNPITVSDQSDTVLFFKGISSIEDNISFSSRLGDLNKEIKNIPLELPFKTSYRYRIIQGNNTNYTHSTDWSRYAIDFSLKVNDTICAATSGFIVGVIDKYQFGGKGAKWRPFGNFITLYDPDSGIFTQYVHLTMGGSLVKVGDRIEQGQPIALSGKTGQTDIEHLHFNCLVPSSDNNGLKSIPFEFIGGYESQGFKRNDWVTK